MTTSAVRASGAIQVLGLCFLAAIFEGIDVQSMGLAAPKLGPEFHLTPVQIGYAATGSVFGAAIGAGVGGWLADRYGRKWTLIQSLVLLAIFSLATAMVHDLQLLIVIRLFTGIGIGAAFPNLIALVTESTPPGARAGSLGMIYGGMPFGAVLAGLLVFFGGATMDWRNIFYVGGIGPLVLIPLLALSLPESPKFKEAKRSVAAPAEPLGRILFGEGRAFTTMLLWVAFLFTLLVVYLLLNWIPSLMVAKGFTRPQGALIAAILNTGAMLGSMSLGRLMDRGHARVVVIGTYTGIAISLAMLAYCQGFALMAISGFSAGFFAVGGQLVLYALAPTRYTTLIRGTGVGSAIAAGRLGSVAGPLMGGALLSAGFGAPAVLGAAVPGLLLAGIAASILVLRPAEVD